MGNVALWKYSPPLGGRVVDGEMKWKLQAPATVEGPIKQIRVRGTSQTCQFTESLSSKSPLFFGKDTCYTCKFYSGALTSTCCLLIPLPMCSC